MDLTAILADLTQEEAPLARVQINLRPDPNEQLVIGSKNIAEVMGVSLRRFMSVHAENMRKAGLLYTLPVQRKKGFKRDQEVAAHRTGIIAYMIAITQLGHTM